MARLIHSPMRARTFGSAESSSKLGTGVSNKSLKSSKSSSPASLFVGRRIGPSLSYLPHHANDRRYALFLTQRARKPRWNFRPVSHQGGRRHISSSNRRGNTLRHAPRKCLKCARVL